MEEKETESTKQKETKTETLKQLTEQHNEERLSLAEKEKRLEDRFNMLYDKLRFAENLEEMSKTLRPLADSMSELVLESKHTLKEMKGTVEMARLELRELFDESRRRTEALREVTTALTWRVWVAVILVGALSAPATFLTYNLYQKFFGTEKVDVRLKRNAR
jgi:hypothetical protein